MDDNIMSPNRRRALGQVLKYIPRYTFSIVCDCKYAAQCAEIYLGKLEVGLDEQPKLVMSSGCEGFVSRSIL